MSAFQSEFYWNEYYNPYYHPEKQTSAASKKTGKIIPKFTNYLYNHTTMRGQFVCLDAQGKVQFIMNRINWTKVQNKGYKTPFNWIRNLKKTFYFDANPRDKKTGKLAGYVQLAIPCHGNKCHIDEVLKVIKERKNIPDPTYVLDDRHHHFTLVFMLKKSVAPNMTQGIRALLWTLAEKIVTLEDQVNQALQYADYHFHVCEKELTTSPKLRLPGSYNDSRMVHVYYNGRTKRYTYRTMLQLFGCNPPYRASYQIEIMKKSIQKIRKGKWLDRFYFDVDKTTDKKRKLDIFIQIDRIHALEEMMFDGYDRMTEQEYTLEYCRLLCHVYDVYYMRSVSEYKIPIFARMIEVIQYLTNDHTIQNQLFKIVQEEVLYKYDYNKNSYLDYLKMESKHDYRFYHLRKKAQLSTYYMVTNNELIERYHLDCDGSWLEKVYLNPTKKRKSKIFLNEKIQNEMIAIARLTLQGLKNSEIMKKLKINKDRFFDRKRRINKEGGMKKIADRQYCFKHWKEQEELKSTCRHPNASYYQAAEVAAA